MKRRISIGMTVIALLSVCIVAGCSSENKEEAATTPTSAAADSQKTQAPTTPAVTPSPEVVESNWELIRDVTYTHPSNMDGFLNENFGVTVGYRGEIHYTEDGGKTWPKAENTSMCRMCLDIVDEKIIWTGGNGREVRMSKDGGKKFVKINPCNAGSIHSNVDFLDEKTGWMCSLKRCFKTTNGGETWEEIALPKEIKNIAAMQLRTEKDAYIFTQVGQLFTTKDKGATWTEQNIGMDAYEVSNEKGQPGLYKNTCAVADVAFTDEKNGVLAFAGIIPNKGNVVYCLTTKDGGATWTSEKISQADGAAITRVYLTADGKYLTLSSAQHRLLLLKNKK